jgi:hypothetical protein
MMNRCLSDRTLLMLHEGEEELQGEREHLERCADCDRRYRRLVDDLARLVTILNEPAPVQHLAPRVTGRQLRWGLAAAAVVTAFICGRITSGSVGGQSSGLEQLSAQAALSPATAGSIEMAALTPASYGIYIDDLMSPDGSDSNVDFAENEATDSDF